jgi:serine/threonine protein kinase
MVVVRRRPRLIGRVVSHYRILEHLGGGGMGVVYKAEDAKLHRVVALKFLAAELTKNASAKERFLHEARAASALDHPNICTIYEVDETLEGQLYLAMAYYDGETLEERIYRGPLPPAEAIGIAIQVARGLGRAHETGFIHRISGSPSSPARSGSPATARRWAPRPTCRPSRRTANRSTRGPTSGLWG